MAVATYLCRASGVVLMSRVTITPRVERALRALPGSIVTATILPLALDGGVPRDPVRSRPPFSRWPRAGFEAPGLSLAAPRGRLRSARNFGL